jgi:transcriptional regulator of acetoin/glycerol metabolism
MPSRQLNTRVAMGRERFLATGTADGWVRSEVLDSWRRSMAWSVQPDGFTPPYRGDVNPEGRLLRAADPVLRRLTATAGDLGLCFLVTDDEARILARWTDSLAMMRLLDRVSADRGHVFSEDAVGTNGLGTAVELRRTVRVNGREHFASVLGEFTCVGVPIWEPLARRIIGVLDLTCAADHNNKLITLLATQTAQQIEQCLYEQQNPREQALLRHFLAARRSISGIVVVSERLMLADPRAGRLLAGFSQPLLWERAGRALQAAGPLEEQLPLPDGGTLSTVMTAIRDGDEAMGVLLQLRPMTGAVARPRTGGAPELPAELVGRSGALLAAFRACRDASATQIVVISGEPGVGKSALGRAVHSCIGQGELHVKDCAAVGSDGVIAWFEDLRSRLGGEPGTLVLQRFNLLPGAERRHVAGLARTSLTRGWRVLVTTVRGDAFPFDSVEVELPPLRERMEDVPALAAVFAGTHRLAPEVVQLLTRLLWPGNVRELRSVVHGMAETANGDATIKLIDVPPGLAAAASRRPLSRFERAEISAILNALADCNGNKTEAARLVGISRSTMYRKLRAGGIDLENTAF